MKRKERHISGLPSSKLASPFFQASRHNLVVTVLGKDCSAQGYLSVTTTWSYSREYFNQSWLLVTYLRPDHLNAGCASLEQPRSPLWYGPVPSLLSFPLWQDSNIWECCTLWRRLGLDDTIWSSCPQISHPVPGLAGTSRLCLWWVAVL